MMLVVVLNDGETYTDLDGCEVLYVPDSTPDEDVDEYVKDNFGTGTPIGELWGD
jgi:hypothetical protein